MKSNPEASTKVMNIGLNICNVTENTTHKRSCQHNTSSVEILKHILPP